MYMPLPGMHVIHRSIIFSHMIAVECNQSVVNASSIHPFGCI